MAVKINKLVPVNLPRLGPGRHSDGGGLYLSVRDGGSRRWVFLYQAPGSKRQRELGLGGQDVSLADARKAAKKAREDVANGVDPIDAKHETVRGERVTAENAVTFGHFAEEYLAGLNFSNAKHRAQWKVSLTEHASALRDIPIRDIKSDDVIGVLQPLYGRVRETAQRTRGRIEKVIGAAAVFGHRAEGPNPARWKDHLEHVFKNRGKRSDANNHHAAVPYKDMPRFMVDLRERRSISAAALEFTILCAARTNETTGATWQEIDFKDKTWTIAAERMKAGREHRVPLSARAIAILKTQKLPDSQPDDFVFRGSTGAALSNMAMLQQLRGLKPGFTVHGFRSSFSDWTGDQSAFDSETREFALAHVKGDKAEAAYRRSTSFEKRRKLMAAWAAYLASGR